MARVSVLSSPYLRYATTAFVNGVLANPTADTVQFAFMARGTDPTAPDWKTGSWETLVGPPAQYVARCQIGPLGATGVMTKGTYIVWIKVIDSPETIVVSVGQLDVV